LFGARRRPGHSAGAAQPAASANRLARGRRAGAHARRGHRRRARRHDRRREQRGSSRPLHAGVVHHSAAGRLVRMRWLQYLAFLVPVVGLAHPTGLYLARVCERQPTFLDPILRPIESWVYRVTGVDECREMTAPVYTWCFVLFGALGTAALFLLL